MGKNTGKLFLILICNVSKIIILLKILKVTAKNLYVNDYFRLDVCLSFRACVYTWDTL